MDKIKIGFPACYQQDYDFEHFADVPVSVAVAWVKAVCPPEMVMGMGIEQTVENLTAENAPQGGWLNKRFVAIACDHDFWLSVYHHNGRFAIGKRKRGDFLSRCRIVWSKDANK